MEEQHLIYPCPDCEDHGPHPIVDENDVRIRCRCRVDQFEFEVKV